MSEQNLARMFALQDRIDREEGEKAYFRYRQVMAGLGEHYGVSIEKVTAAFCALSPNNDYTGNLRSLVSVLEGFARGWPAEKIVVSTYGHCKFRALSYVNGSASFTDSVKGLKITNFYNNVLYPEDNRWVTIDGHMCAAYRGERLTMKEAIVRGAREYRMIADATKKLAFEAFLLPNQYQAIVWFVRKRVLGIKYDPQMSLMVPADDVWRTLRNVSEIKPYG